MNTERRLVIYYSFEGNTRLVAEVIAEATRATLAELHPDAEPVSKGFAKYLWYGRQRMMRRTPRLLPLEVDPSEYELVFVGAPVWAFAPAPPVAAFLKAHPLAGKRVALFCTHEGGAGRTLEIMRRAMPGATVVGEIDVLYALRDREATAARVRTWARDVMHRAGDAPATDRPGRR